MKEGPIVKKSFEFSVSVMKYCDDLCSKRKFVIANQLLRSGTSIGANVFEAQHAESRADFIHKMKIALKEATETGYWLRLCETIEEVAFRKEMLYEIKEISAILSAIIYSTRQNQK